MGGRSCFITSGAFGHGLMYTVLSTHGTMSDTENSLYIPDAGLQNIFAEVPSGGSG